MNGIKKYFDDELGEKIKYINEVDKFLEELITTKYIFPKYGEGTTNYFQILRNINSYYPSFYDVTGGCYIISYFGLYTIIDPGYKTLEELRENRIDTRLIANIIVTHNHPDHVGGLNELLDLLFKQNTKESTQQYKLFLNPGTFREYEHRSNDDKNFKIQEIKCCRPYSLSNSNDFSFTAFTVPHKGIGKKQKSIALIFQIKEQDQILRFGLTGDLDGEEKYMEYYKKNFNNLYFLVLHIGSLKFKEIDDIIEKKDKHLYIDGAFRLMNSLNNVKAYVIQEFGLEVLEPEDLANTLSKVLFNNGYYFPYLIFRMKALNEMENLQKKLLKYLIPNFFIKILKNEKFITKWWEGFDIFDEILSDIIEFSRSLCLDFEVENNKIKKVNYLNFWKKDIDNFEKNQTEELISLFKKAWKHIHEVIYLGIDKPDNNLITNIANRIQKYFPEFEFVPVIKNNCKKILDYFSSEDIHDIIELFEEYFKKEEVERKKNDIDDSIFVNVFREDEMLWRIEKLEEKFENNAITNLDILEIFPLILFLIELKVLADKCEKPEKKRAFLGWLRKKDDIRSDLLKVYEKKLIGKNIYIGKHGDKFYFRNYFVKEYFCIECQNRFKTPRDGTYLFNKYPPCTNCQAMEEYHNQISQEDYYIENNNKDLETLKAEEEAQREANESWRREEEWAEIIHDNIIYYLKKKKFNKALKLIREETYYSKRILKSEIFDLLKPNFKHNIVREIIWYYFLNSIYDAEFIEPEIYNELYKIIVQDTFNRISEKNWEILDSLMVKIKKILKRLENLNTQIQFFSKKENYKELVKKYEIEFSIYPPLITETFLKILDFSQKYKLEKNQLYKNFTYLSNIINGLPDKEIISLRKQIYNDLNFESNKEQQKSLKDIFEDRKVKRIFEEKFNF